MAEKEHVLAIDLGASNGRAVIASYDKEKIEIKEIDRFSNDPVLVHGTMYWDILRLLWNIKQSLIKSKAYAAVESIAVDTWGVDFGILDNNGMLMDNPVHYRDSRTVGMVEKSFDNLDEQVFYYETGNQFMNINTVFQLLALQEKRPLMFHTIDKILLMPDLLHYFLCGVKVSEMSIASTTQMLNQNQRRWSDKVIKALNIPAGILPPIVESGTILGDLRDDICTELGIEPMKVIAVAGHDTQSAMAAVPTQEEFIFISCGTWSLVGTELQCPVINDLSMKYNMTNEQGVEGKTAFLKNIVGLWLIQESRRQWIVEGNTYSFGELEEMAGRAKAFQCFIDPDNPSFSTPGNIPERIREFCRKTGQHVPENQGEIVRCIDESLALKYYHTIKQISSCTHNKYQKVYMVGGGIQSTMLCQMTADASGYPVVAGPVEATVYGNAATQLMALKKIQNLAEIRRVVRNSVTLSVYDPKEHDKWLSAYQTFITILGLDE